MNYSHLISDVRTYLAEKETAVLEDWYELIRHVSISETGEGVEACCDWIKVKMEELHINVTKYPVKPFPVLVGRYGNDPKKKTVLLYAHYDVKPSGDLSKWNTDPFVPTVIDGKVYARGSADNKSPLMAHLKALEYYQERSLEVPVNLLYIFEGCEESGSTGLPEFLDEHRDELHADVVYFSDGSKDPSGKPIIALGCKGHLSLEIVLKTMNKNVHSRYAPVLPSASWQLVELLGKLHQGDQVLVPGFYDGIEPTKESELKILRELPSSEAELNAIYEAKPANYGEQFYKRLLCDPTFNLQKISSGANGVVAAEATASIDIRLVAGQDGQDIYNKVCAYIKDLGYDNVTVKFGGTTRPSKTDVDTPYLPAIEEICREIYGEYIIYPCRPSSAPDFLWTDIMKLPAVQVRWSDADSDNHAPNEKLSIKEYLDGIALCVCAFQAIANV